MGMPTDNGFSEEQKQYLHGFASGSGLVRSLTVLPVLTSTVESFA